jgi:lipopolysaccharide export system protein LptA
MSAKRPRITIERLRTLVLIGGGLLIAAIAIFLAAGQWKLRKAIKDLPGRLGIDIQQSANGVDYTQSRKGKTLFRIHASRAVQMKKDGKTLLHDVKIDLYGEDGSRTDTISGAEFEYDPGAGLAEAAGPVEITLMRPGVQPAIADLKAGAKPGPPPTAKLPAIASGVTDSEIHVKTSGLRFNQKTGVATTERRVDFALKQGTGSSTGATYDSGHGQLILDSAVELHIERPSQSGQSGPVTVHATHAEFERTGQQCSLTRAKADYSGGTVQIGDALLHFRDDGSVIRLDGSGGVDLETDTGSHLTAPRGNLEFDEKNHPQHGLLEGGAKLETTQPDRQIQGTAPTARLLFDRAGQLHQAHLERGVLFHLQQRGTSAKGGAFETQRNWSSQVADVAFAPAMGKPAKASNDQLPDGARVGSKTGSRVEAREIRGTGGVVIMSDSTGVGGPPPSKLVADSVVAELAAGGAISTLSGTGHASFEQRTLAGVHQSSSSDQLDVRFEPETKGSAKAKTAEGSEIASMTQQGHVVLVQEPLPGAPAKAGKSPASPIRATSERSEYDGQTQQMHLFGSPRLKDGALDMTSNQMMFSRATGDALATGDVKASWVAAAEGSAAGATGALLSGTSLLGGSAGGNGPIHAVAPVAELHQATEEVIFRGAVSDTQSGMQPRLWQGANSIAAPTITLNRQKQTLFALARGAANPVRTVLLSNTSMKGGPAKSRSDAPSLIRLRSGDLRYSEGERVAFLNAGSVGSVTAETTGSGGAATVVSQQAEVHLLPAGVHGQTVKATSLSGGSNSSVDSMTALGHVTVDWPGRRGTGEKLVYQSEDSTFTLTGTAAVPPTITDQVRGTVTGSALIFHSRDDSVTVEGDGGKTVTETHTPKK